jgi:hypothetical protein
VRELVKLFAGDWDYMPDAAKDHFLEVMSSKSRALSLEIVQEFTEAMTLLGDERGLAFPPARELQLILPGIQGMVRGKLSMAEMVEQFPVWRFSSRWRRTET